MRREAKDCRSAEAAETTFRPRHFPDGSPNLASVAGNRHATRLSLSNSTRASFAGRLQQCHYLVPTPFPPFRSHRNQDRGDHAETSEELALRMIPARPNETDMSDRRREERVDRSEELIAKQRADTKRVAVRSIAWLRLLVCREWVGRVTLA